MSIVNFEASGYGYVRNGNADTDYFAARNLTTGSFDGVVPIVGQQMTAGTPSYYRIYRGFIFFDTSGLPDDALITAATFKFVNLAWDHSDTDFNIIVRSGDNAHIPVVVEDYDLTLYGGDNLGQLTTHPPTTAGHYLNFTLNDLGIAHINKTGTTKFVLLSEEDINNSPPTLNEEMSGDEYVQYGTATPATITITYFEPTETPTVETLDLGCEDRQSTTLTAIGEITATGDGYIYRGFEYYQYDSEYDSSMWAVREIGRFATPCVYRMTLSGLKPSTIYWIRAFAGNIFGISYGEWVLCSTLGVPSVPSYDMHESSDTPTICFYIRKVGGKWSIKHGPYTTDQSDIEITKILEAQGKGKYQIKFESDVLTGISAGVMCKVDIKAR